MCCQELMLWYDLVNSDEIEECYYELPFDGVAVLLC